MKSLQASILALVVTFAILAFGAVPAGAHAGNTDPSVRHVCEGPLGSIRDVGAWGACIPTETPKHWIDLGRLLDRLRVLEGLLTCIGLQAAGEINGVGGPHLLITGCNVHIRSGSGATVDTTNLGNLIIGYNEPRGGTDTSNRTGSHNVVLGPRHQFTASGGFVAGLENAVTANAASVSGGNLNTASGEATSVSGGGNNTASGFLASVSGGFLNTASGNEASVSGGVGNTASNTGSSVSGGNLNTASGFRASVSGGNSRSATGDDDWVAGGLFQDN